MMMFDGDEQGSSPWKDFAVGSFYGLLICVATWTVLLLMFVERG